MKKQKNCGMNEEFRWVIPLVLQEIVRLVLTLVKKDKNEPKRTNGSAARKQTE